MAVLPIGIGSAVAGGYNIERSLRFNSADSAYLNRTPASAGSRTTWTWSGWLKRTTLSGTGTIISAGTSTIFIVHWSSDSLRFRGTTLEYITTRKFRDSSAWYHLVMVADTTNGTAADRFKVYINGVRETSFSTNDTAGSSEQFEWNNNVVHNIGRYAATSGSYFDGYQTETYFIDGQALTPSSFGETDSATGVWKPKAYSGTYGTNGFYLKFADNSGATSTTLGKDTSGNGNNWTPNNFSVTAGAGNDSLVDTPTAYGTDTGVGGEVRGNYATWNSLLDWKTNGSAFTLSNGNLDVSEPSATTWGSVASTISMPSGKWYCEITATTVGAAQYTFVGITATTSAAGFPGETATSYSYRANGNKLNNDATGAGVAYGASYAANDIIGIAFDADAGSLTFYKNGASQGTAYTGISAGSYYFVVGDFATSQSSAFTANFGQRAFAYTAPSGFKALCTQNLPTPTIGATSTTQANKYFDVKLWTGNGSTQSITGIGFQPDLVWTKDRGAAFDHTLFDAVRGATIFLRSNATSADETRTDSLTSFNSDGFSVGADAVRNNINKSAASYVSWAWDANGAGSSNTAGSITSTVSANTTSGFSIVTYSGAGTTSSTIGHGLGVAPSMFIIKCRNNFTGATVWPVYHASVGNTAYLDLSSTNAASTLTAGWNNTSPTSTVFTVGSAAGVNGSGNTFVAYCFAAVAGYSAFGSYTGNGSADGPFIYTGFRPKFFMTKRTNGLGDNWHIHDTTRSTYNIAYADLRPNTSDAENTSAYPIDILSNGIKWRQGGADGNESGGTYIYAAFAESPFKYSLAR